MYQEYSIIIWSCSYVSDRLAIIITIECHNSLLPQFMFALVVQCTQKCHSPLYPMELRLAGGNFHTNNIVCRVTSSRESTYTEKLEDYFTIATIGMTLKIIVEWSHSYNTV